MQLSLQQREDRPANECGRQQTYETPTLTRLGTVQRLTAGNMTAGPDVTLVGNVPVS